MMSADVVGEKVAKVFIKLAYKISLHFPYHGIALKSELEERRLTNDQWNKISAILASLRALPGIALIQEEHNVRNIVLSAIEIPRQMAQATFGVRGDERVYLERANRWCDELDLDLENGIH